MPMGAGPRVVTEAGWRKVTYKATSRGVECRLRGCLRLASLAEISAAGASRQPGAGRQQIALDEWGGDASPDLRSESPIHSQQVKSGGLTTLCSRRRAWRIIWSGDRRRWMVERSQFSRTPPMVERDSIPATATFTAPRAGIWTELKMRDPLSRAHRGGASSLECGSRCLTTLVAR